MKVITVVLSLGLIVCSGCRTISIKSEFGGEKDSTGLVYATAIKSLSVEVKYVTRQKKELKYGVETELNAVPDVIAVQAVVKSMLLPDPRNVFVVDTEKITDAGFFDATLKYEVTENGLLVAANTDLTDKTSEVVKEAAGALLTVVKLAAMAKGPELPSELRPLADRIKAIYKELEETGARGDARERRAQLMQEIEDLYKVINLHVKNNKEEWVVSEPKSVSFSVPYDFAGFEKTKDKEGKVVYEKLYHLDGLVKGVKVVPSVRVRLYLSTKEYQNASRTRDGTADGFVYRVPHQVRVQVTILNPSDEECCSYDEYIGIPQVSPFYIVPSKSKAWTKRSTELKFGPNSGSLIYLGNSAGSSAEGASKTVQETVSKIDGKLGEIRDASRNYERAVIESKTNLFDAEMKYLQAQKALSDYKKQMEDAGASQGRP